MTAEPALCPCGRAAPGASRARFPEAAGHAPPPWAALLRVCAACELVYLDAPAAPPGGGYRFAGPLDDLSAWLRRRRAAWVARALPRGASVLDVGAGRGALLAELQRRGCRVLGLEVDAERARAAPPGVRVEAGTLASAAPALARAGPFDALVFWHALEHHSAPVADLRRAAELVRPGGLLFVAVPNAGSLDARLAGPHWLHLDLPHHRFHFTADTLAAAARDAGFAPERLRTGQWEMDLAGLVDALGVRLGLPPRACFDALRGEARPGLARRAAALVGVAALAGPAVLLALVGRLTGRAGTLILVARRTSAAEGA